METSHSNSIIVVGVIAHVDPKYLADFKHQIENSPYVKRLIILKESNDKLWIVSGDAPD